MKISMLPAACFLILVHVTISKGESVSGIIRQHQRSEHVPGIAVSAYLKNGRAAQDIVFGQANVENRSRISARSVFRIASVSKTFTALAIMKLAEQGKLSTSDLLSKYFPNFPRADEVTLRNMLQHTSGLPDFSKNVEFRANPAKDWTPEEEVALMTRMDYQFDPGTNANYCNSNFMMLAMIIQMVSGQSYGDFVQTEVCRPLGMTNTRAGSDTAIIRNRVAGYVYNGHLQNAQFTSVMAPLGTGNMMSTASDMGKLFKGFIAGKLLSEASIKEMTGLTQLKDGSTWTSTPDAAGRITSYGYGIELIKLKGARHWLITKGGALPGFHSFFAYSREAGVALGVIENLGPQGMAMEDMTYDILRKYKAVK